MPIEHEYEAEGEEDAVFAYLFDGIVVKEDVAPDLGVAEHHIYYLEVPLIL